MMLAAVKITFLAGLALTGFDSVPTADGEPRIAAAVDVQNITPAPGPLIQEAALPTEPNPPSASPTLVSVAAPSAPLPERADDVSPASFMRKESSTRCSFTGYWNSQQGEFF